MMASRLSLIGDTDVTIEVEDWPSDWRGPEDGERYKTVAITRNKGSLTNAQEVVLFFNWENWERFVAEIEDGMF